MLWPVLTLCAAALMLPLALPVVLHAFRRSVGTGVMVTFIPGYFFLYAFSQFQHRYRHVLIPTLLGAAVLTGVFGGLATSGLARADEHDKGGETWAP